MSVEVADKEGLNLSGGVSQNDGQNDPYVRIIEEIKSLEILEPKNFLAELYGQRVADARPKAQDQILNIADATTSANDVRFDNGNDIVDMTRSIVNDAKIDAGDGDNKLRIHDNIEVRGLRFDAGAGNDEIEIRNNVGIKDHTLLYTNDGDDSVKIYGATMENAAIHTGLDNDVIDIQRCEIKNGADIRLGGGNDTINTDWVGFFGDTKISLSSFTNPNEVDTLNMDNTIFNGHTTIEANDGEKTTMNIKVCGGDGEIDIKGSHANLDHTPLFDMNFLGPKFMGDVKFDGRNNKVNMHIDDSEFHGKNNEFYFSDNQNDTLNVTSAIIKNSKFYLGGGDDTVSLTMTRTDIDNNTQIFGGKGYDTLVLDNNIDFSKVSGFEELKVTSGAYVTLNGNDVAHLSDILDNGSNVVKFSEAHGTVKLNGFSETSGAENGYHRYESAYNTHLADGSDRQGTVYIDIKEDIHVDL